MTTTHLEMPMKLKHEFDKVMSPGARAVLHYIEESEQGKEVELFDNDPERERLVKMIDTFKGSLHLAIKKRLDEVFELSGISVITQRDLMREIKELWSENISRLNTTEIQLLKYRFEKPGLSLHALSKDIDLSYAQTRRSYARLRNCGILKTEGILNHHALGLERILVMLESPEFVLASDYVRKTLFSDSATLVFMIATIPSKRVDDLLQTVRGLRNVSKSATAWRLAAGRTKFNGRYINPSSGLMKPEFRLHWRLMLRKNNDELVVGDGVKGLQHENKFTRAELRVVDQLLYDYNATAKDIVKRTRLSESTAFRKRKNILDSGLVVPRPIIKIPLFNDYLLALFSPKSVGDYMEAWNCLPLTYMSLLSNIENSDRLVLVHSVLPRGISRELKNIMTEEGSKIDEYRIFFIDAGIKNQLKMSSMWAGQGEWKWDSTVMDVRSYSVARREASPNNIPLDLA
jgi:DNA-binding Lrp family transcriptional regulator